MRNFLPPGRRPYGPEARRYLEAKKNMENEGCNGIKRVSKSIINKAGKAHRLSINEVQAVLAAGIRGTLKGGSHGVARVDY
jgi:hypothetical protein